MRCHFSLSDGTFPGLLLYPLFSLRLVVCAAVVTLPRVCATVAAARFRLPRAPATDEFANHNKK